MCARSKTGETNTSDVQNNEHSRGLNNLTRKIIQEQAEGNSHVAKNQVGGCSSSETNTTFYRDYLAIVTEKQRVLVWAVYDRIGKWQHTKSYK
jgi:response regulator of citrate/malate metabolism